MAPIPNEKSGLAEIPQNSFELSEKIKQILKSNGIQDPVSQVIIKDAGLKGDGFASLSQYVTVKFVDPEKKPLNLFVKAQTGNPSHTEILTEMMAFEKEARFLTDYCTAAKEMCKLKGHPDFIDFYPKCYYGDSKMLVMENLVLDKGYSLKKKKDRQTLEDAKTALKTLAKHHAIGHVMIQENGGPKKFFEKFPELKVECLDNEFVINLLAGIVNNGDYWNNNMMFLVDPNTKKNVHHVAIDFQVTRYNTPAIDLTYYLYNSVQADVRRNHLLELLTLYKNTLNETTKDFGHPTNLTLDQIFKDFREKIGYGFWYGFVMHVGPGMVLFKDVDVSKIDMKDWPVIMGQLVSKWVDENPEKGKETAEEIVKLLREYEQLKM